MSQKPEPCHRSKWSGDHDLGIIGQPDAVIGIRPHPVKDVFTIAIGFEIGGGRLHQLFTLMDQDVSGKPAFTGPHTPGTLSINTAFLV